MEKLKVGILGTGKIGTDLLIKVMRSNEIECTIFIGRRNDSDGIKKARSLGIRVSTEKIDFLLKNPKICDLVFDATSAGQHLVHSPILKQLGKTIIDLTPSNLGQMVIPLVVDSSKIASQKHINMISCGGQASIPLACAVKNSHSEIDYIEVVSTIASKSAGPATRSNLDEYITNTERGLKYFTNAKTTKAILILNPAVPEINMKTTLYAKVKNLNIANVVEEIDKLLPRLHEYVPDYKIIVPPMIKDGNLMISIGVQGRGDWLPKYAGNLDIINCAAIKTAEMIHKTNLQKQKSLICEK